MSNLRDAEKYISETSCLYRHYDISEVQRAVSDKTGINLTDDEAINIVSSLRERKGYGPIRDHNLPGWQEGDDDGTEDVGEQTVTPESSRSSWFSRMFG